MKRVRKLIKLAHCEICGGSMPPGVGNLCDGCLDEVLNRPALPVKTVLATKPPVSGRKRIFELRSKKGL
jgi:hypothetical protein